jgi:RNA polymerase sigma-70 factor, ECF subfamily
MSAATCVAPKRVTDLHRILVDQAMRGDEEAFARLVDASIDRCYAVATLILRDRESAQDAVQEAFVSARRDIASLRDPGAWEAWLNRLTVRSCYRLARKQRRRNVVELRVMPDLDAAGDPDLAVGVVERDEIERRLGQLPVDQRAVIVVHFFLDLPLTDAARVLEIPVGTAKSRLHRALRSLRITMRPEQDEPQPIQERTA